MAWMPLGDGFLDHRIVPQVRDKLAKKNIIDIISRKGEKVDALICVISISHIDWVEKSKIKWKLV